LLISNLERKHYIEEKYDEEILDIFYKVFLNEKFFDKLVEHKRYIHDDIKMKLKSKLGRFELLETIFTILSNDELQEIQEILSSREINNDILLDILERLKIPEYDYLSFKRLKENDYIKLDDIVIKLKKPINEHNGICLPYSGGDPDKEINIKILTFMPPKSEK
jgi:hypothetical protein